jgi:hypothetical protein
MHARTKVTPGFIWAGWSIALLSFFIAVLSGLAGGLVAWLTRYFAGHEMLILFALLSFWLALLLSAVKFDFMVLIAFGLFGVVWIEPAPVDALFMILLLVGLLTGKLSSKALKGSSLIHLALWVFLVANFASLIVAKAFFDSLRYLMITVYLVAFAYFVRTYVASFQAMRNVMIGYLASALLNAFLIALGYLGVSPFTELFLEFGTRAVGTFKDANVLGPFLIPMIVLLLDEIFFPRLFPRFYLAKALGVIGLSAAVFLSFSRAAWANLAITLLAYFILNIGAVFGTGVTGPLKRGGSFLLLAVGGSWAFGSLLNWMGLRQFFEWRIASHGYDVERFVRQKEGIDAGLTHLFGVGPGMWSSAHSLYVRTFAEHGIFGLVALLVCILILSIGVFSRALRETDKPYGLSAKVVLACLGGHLANSVVIDTIHWRHFWFILALAWVVITVETSASPGHWAGNRGVE